MRFLFLGTTRGDVLIADLDNASLSKYNIPYSDVRPSLTDTCLEEQDVVDVTVCPVDENRILIAYATGALILWDVNSRKVHRVYQQTAGLRSVAWSPDGECFVCGYHDGLLRFWRRTDHAQPISVLALEQEHLQQPPANDAAANKPSAAQGSAPVRRLVWRAPTVYERRTLRYKYGTIYVLGGDAPNSARNGVWMVRGAQGHTPYSKSHRPVVAMCTSGNSPSELVDFVVIDAEQTSASFDALLMDDVNSSRPQSQADTKEPQAAASSSANNGSSSDNNNSNNNSENESSNSNVLTPCILSVNVDAEPIVSFGGLKHDIPVMPIGDMHCAHFIAGHSGAKLSTRAARLSKFVQVLQSIQRRSCRAIAKYSIPQLMKRKIWPLIGGQAGGYAVQDAKIEELFTAGVLITGHSHGVIRFWNMPSSTHMSLLYEMDADDVLMHDVENSTDNVDREELAEHLQSLMDEMNADDHGTLDVVRLTFDLPTYTLVIGQRSGNVTVAQLAQQHAPKSPSSLSISSTASRTSRYRRSSFYQAEADSTVLSSITSPLQSPAVTVVSAASAASPSLSPTADSALSITVTVPALEAQSPPAVAGLGAETASTPPPTQLQQQQQQSVHNHNNHNHNDDASDDESDGNRQNSAKRPIPAFEMQCSTVHVHGIRTLLHCASLARLVVSDEGGGISITDTQRHQTLMYDTISATSVATHIHVGPVAISDDAVMPYVYFGMSDGSIGCHNINGAPICQYTLDSVAETTNSTKSLSSGTKSRHPQRPIRFIQTFDIHGRPYQNAAPLRGAENVLCIVAGRHVMITTSPDATHDKEQAKLHTIRSKQLAAPAVSVSMIHPSSPAMHKHRALAIIDASFTLTIVTLADLRIVRRFNIHRRTMLENGTWGCFATPTGQLITLQKNASGDEHASSIYRANIYSTKNTTLKPSVAWNPRADVSGVHALLHAKRIGPRKSFFGFNATNPVDKLYDEPMYDSTVEPLFLPVTEADKGTMARNALFGDQKVAAVAVAERAPVDRTVRVKEEAARSQNATRLMVTKAARNNERVC
jgi:WD domain, G-beta repeat